MLLREKDRMQLERIFSEIQEPVEILAYGSRVNGTAHQGSDLDLVFRKKDSNQADIDLLMSLKDKIHESNVPIMVEIRDWNMLPNSFHEQIEKQHETMFRNF